jgi:hypothetical protein
MAILHIDTVLAAMQAVPATIAIAQGKEPATRTLCGVLLAVALWLVLDHQWEVIENLTTATLHQALALAAAVLGVIVAVRIRQPVLGTLIITGGVLLAALALDVVRG